MTKILIINFGTRLNKGSAALLNSQIKLLSEFVPDANFTIFTYYPEIDYIQYDLKLIGAIGRDLSPIKMFKKIFLAFLCGLWFILHKYLNLNVNVSIKGKRLHEYATQHRIREILKDSLAPFTTLSALFKCSLWAILHKWFSLDAKILLNGKLREYYDAELVLPTGGDNFTEDYGSPFSHFSNLLFAILLNK